MGEAAVRPFWRKSSTAVLVVAVGGAVTLGPAAPALAAPGDASARGVVVDLSAVVAGITVISADATIGTATAPAGGGTDTSTALAITLPGAIGVTASGTVVQVSATRGPTASSANASIADLALGILGTPVLAAEAITAAVNCPTVGAQSADTTLVGLELFGTPVEVAPNTPAVTASAAVAVAGLLGATLNASVTRVETVTETGATAIAVLASLTLTGTVAGVPVTIPVGTVILAEAICERPAAAPPTQSPVPPQPPAPDPGLPVTGTSIGVLLSIGLVLILTGVMALLAYRRHSRSTSFVA